MINNRQAGRRRGRGGQQQRPQGGSGRPDNGNRIDNRARGNAAQLLEKYKTLARDAQMQGDRVNVEYYLQFADHYFRVLAETRARFEENGGQSTGRRIQGATLDDDDQEYEDEGERVPNDRGQNDRGQSERVPDGYRGQDGTERGGRPLSGNGGHYASDDRAGRMNGNAGGNGGDYRDPSQARPLRDDRADRAVRPSRPEQRPDPRPEYRAEPVREEAPQPEAGSARPDDVPAEAPRRGRGRPRREAVADVPSLDAERLPPSLGLSAVAEAGDAEIAASPEDKPRRRRGRPPAAAAPADRSAD